MLEEIIGAVESQAINPLDGKVHKLVKGEVEVITTDLVADLKPGDKVPEAKKNPAVQAALKGKSVIVNRKQSK